MQTVLQCIIYQYEFSITVTGDIFKLAHIYLVGMMLNSHSRSSEKIVSKQDELSASSLKFTLLIRLCVCWWRSVVHMPWPVYNLIVLIRLHSLSFSNWEIDVFHRLYIVLWFFGPVCLLPFVQFVPTSASSKYHYSITSIVFSMNTLFMTWKFSITSAELSFISR